MGTQRIYHRTIFLISTEQRSKDLRNDVEQIDKENYYITLVEAIKTRSNEEK